MKKVYRIIRKKKNVRRLAALWLFLLVIELFCPAFGDEAAFAAEITAPKSEIKASIEENDKSSKTSVSAFNVEDRHHEQAACNDECLCHAQAIPSINIITFKETVLRCEEIPFCYGNQVFNYLPPPFEPPKNS